MIEKIRELTRNSKSQTDRRFLPKEIQMDLYLRFFVRDEGEKDEMIATKIYLDYSDDFKYLID